MAVSVHVILSDVGLGQISWEAIPVSGGGQSPLHTCQAEKGEWRTAGKALSRGPPASCGLGAFAYPGDEVIERGVPLTLGVFV